MDELTIHQIDNIRDQLVVYPRKTTDIATKKEPDPIFMFEENDGYLGVPRGWYIKNITKKHEEILDVSLGGKMADLSTRYRADGPFIEQEAALRVFLARMDGEDFWGGILQAGCGWGKCQKYDTMVATDNGIFEMGDIVPESLDLDDESTVSSGEKVEGFNGIQEVSHLYGKRSAPCLRITTSQGYSISGTYVHPVMVLGRKGFEWKRSSDVQVGDYLVGKTYDLKGHPVSWGDNDFGFKGVMTEDDAYMMGLLTGDGGLSQNRITLSSKDEEIVDFFCKYWSDRGIESISHCGKYDYRVGHGAAACRRILGGVGLSLTTSHYKEIPWSIMRGGKSMAVPFVQGLMDSDGSVDTSFLIVEITSSSKKLIGQLQFLLLGFGIKSCVARKSGRYKGERVYHWRLSINRGDIKRYYEKIGFRLKRKNEVLKCAVNNVNLVSPNIYTVPVGSLMRDEIDRIFDYKIRHSFKNYTSGGHNPSLKQVKRFIKEANLENSKLWIEISREDLFFDRVVSVEDDGLNRVCDFTIPCGENYIANGIVVHNTIWSLELARRLGRRTFILVHKEFFLKQWRKRIEYLIPGAKVGIVRQSKCEFEGKDFVIGMIQSLARDNGEKYPSELYKSAFGMVISDEVHRIASATWSVVMPRFSAKYRVGLSATPRRKDGAQDVFLNHIGNVEYKAKSKAHVPNLRKLITHSRLKPISRGKYYVSVSNLNSAQILTQLGGDQFRAKDIVDDLVLAVKNGRKVMVVSERIAHLKMMSDMLTNSLFDMDLPFIPRVDFYTGEWFTGEVWETTTKGHRRGDPKMAKRTEDDLEKAESANVIFATKQMCEEGLDIEALDVVVLSLPMSDVEQTVGRVRRWCFAEKEKCERLCPWRAGTCKEKPEPVVLDVFDEEVPQILPKWKARQRFYKRIGTMGKKGKSDEETCGRQEKLPT